MEPKLSGAILDKNIGVVIVENTMSIASTIRRALVESGYVNVFIAHSVQDALNTLQNNSIGWIFSSVFEGERLNVWHLLRLPLEFQAHEQIMVSVLVNADQKGYYDDYFAFGALSVHDRQLTFNSFLVEIVALTQRLQDFPQLPAAVGADVRERMIAASRWDDLEKLELELLDKVDDSPAQKLRVIEAQLKADSKIEAMMRMKQAAQAHPEIADDLRQLSQRFLGTSDLQGFRGNVPVRSVLIVDPDAAQQKQVATIFKEIGADRIITCSTLEEGCAALHENKFDLIVTEWKLGKFEGHAFIQHVRQHDHEKEPVIIYSSLVKPEDMPLIDELKGVFIILKSSQKKFFLQSLNESLQRWNFPQEAGDVEAKIMNDLSAGKNEQAKLLNQGFQANPKVDKQRKEYIRALFAFHEGEWQEAKDIIMASAKQGVPSHRQISLLGKIFLRLGEPENAMRFLEQANQMVPGNIDRLCMLADASAEVGRPDHALAVATEARKIGGDIGVVQSTFAKHAVAAGKIEEASDLLDDEGVARDMVGFMNNLGIAHAAAMRWEESARSYKDALKALEGRHPQLEVIINYNLALSYARQNRLKESKEILAKVQAAGESLVQKKAADLSERVEKAIASKQPLVLKEANREEAAPRLKMSVSIQQQLNYDGRAQVESHGLFKILEPDFRTPGLDLQSEFPKNMSKKTGG